MLPEFESDIDLISYYLRSHFGGQRQTLSPLLQKNLSQFYDSLDYALFSGGKRFRPLLSLLTAEALGIDKKRVLPFASAVEMIHTYSLIHDDLPAMDDDDVRRGKPTHHIAYGEAFAILAGDSLLTEAFRMTAFMDFPAEASLKAQNLLSEASGALGMVGGQVLDITFEDTKDVPLEVLQKTHELKTGALISASVRGVGVLAGISVERTEILNRFSRALGFAFQLADDIEDFDPTNPEKVSYPRLLGLEQTKSMLKATTLEAFQCLKDLGGKTEKLEKLTRFNAERVGVQ